MRDEGTMTRRDVMVLLGASFASCGRSKPPPVETPQDLTALNASRAVAAMRNGQLKAEDYAAALLDRYQETIDLNAFISIDPDRIMEAARAADRRQAEGEPLPG